MIFQSEHQVFVLTIVATATLVAGDPVTAAGAKATNGTNFVGIAMSDAAIGGTVPCLVNGVAAVRIDSGSSGVAVGDPIKYASNGYDNAGTAVGFATALDAGSASGVIRILLQKPAAKAGTALTAADASTVDGTYGAQEQAVIGNLRTRVGEMEARLQALGLLA